VTGPPPRSGVTPSRSRASAAGLTLVELVTAVAATMVVGAMAVPLMRSAQDDRDVRGAARHLAAVLQAQRQDAIARAASTAVRFQSTPAGTRFAVFVDGNGNGVRATDITKGTDSQVSPWESITDHFPDVTFGLAPDVTDMDSGDVLTGSPVRIGGSDLLSFSPTGTASSATLYLRGRHDQQYAVRVLGVTGRIRMVRFDRQTRAWVAP